MSRFFSYLNTARGIITSYNGEEPFSSFLKKKFAENKKYGSKDRKQISHLCYCFFRLGKMAVDIAIEERILAGLFLCSDSSNELLENLKPEWNEKASISLYEKIELAGHPYSLTDVFPWKESISDVIEYEKFCESFFIQPDLFIRLRPGQEDAVMLKLSDSNISFNTVGKNCLVFPNATKINEIIEVDKEAVIQDYNSQQTLEVAKPGIAALKRKISVWDCCAASGGKSIIAKDILGEIDLTVSDIRESILANLRKRFARAGIGRYKSFVADLSKPFSKDNHGPFDLVIADVPCSGSGTWSRTPEQLYFFDETAVDTYTSLQKKIISTIMPHIHPNGYLLYITCSVFKKENEEAIEFIRKEFSLSLISMELLKGYNKKADTLFVALLKKEL